MSAYLNAIAGAVPGHDIHDAFIDWARERLVDTRQQKLFDRMTQRAGIDHRWSVLPHGDHGGSPVDPGGFYHRGMPGTSERMSVYAAEAPRLAEQAVRTLGEQADMGGITHLVVASCTGFVAPGVDQLLAARLGLGGEIERTLVGYMGCYGAVAALRLARHIVRSEPTSRVLVVTVELSTLHLQPETRLEPLLAMLLFGDGAAAALVTAEATGLSLDEPFSRTLPHSEELIRWDVTDSGFAMHLSGEVPQRLAGALGDSAFLHDLFEHDNGPRAIDAWAVHAGGRSILDAVEKGFGLGSDALDVSRDILHRYGNMSSSTLMFAIAELFERSACENGVAMAFGPGVAAEGFRFRRAA